MSSIAEIQEEENRKNFKELARHQKADTRLRKLLHERRPKLAAFWDDESPETKLQVIRELRSESDSFDRRMARIDVPNFVHGVASSSAHTQTAINFHRRQNKERYKKRGDSKRESILQVEKVAKEYRTQRANNEALYRKEDWARQIQNIRDEREAQDTAAAAQAAAQAAADKQRLVALAATLKAFDRAAPPPVVAAPDAEALRAAARVRWNASIAYRDISQGAGARVRGPAGTPKEPKGILKKHFRF